jgi:hypothetical protein
MAERDPIINPKSSGSGSTPRGDTLNGSPKTKSIDGGGANYSPYKSSNIGGAPVPNSPYKK